MLTNNIAPLSCTYNHRHNCSLVVPSCSLFVLITLLLSPTPRSRFYPINGEPAPTRCLRVSSTARRPVPEESMLASSAKGAVPSSPGLALCLLSIFSAAPAGHAWILTPPTAGRPTSLSSSATTTIASSNGSPWALNSRRVPRARSAAQQDDTRRRSTWKLLWPAAIEHTIIAVS